MQNLQEDLINILKEVDNLVIDGKLNKLKIIEKVLKLDEEIISKLISNENIKKQFFKTVGGILVFDKIEFQRFVNNKSFLPDSYTSYKKRIGLTTAGDSNDDFISSSKNVVLSFPHKDCILEGGQTREEQKRLEIFWNTTLSPDNIDRLLSPKVFTNFIRIDKDKRDDNIDFDNTNGLVFKGNNLLTISSLLKNHRNSIKLIYIDPPYNTGGDANTFAYNNTFNHSTWLTFMKNRLEVSKELLKENGCICIAIDDEEYAHLKVLCDEIFNRENYVGTLVVQSNPRGRTTNAHFATTHEYCLVYSKNIDKIKVNNQPLSDDQIEDFDQKDKNGRFRYLPFRRSGGTSTPKERPNSEFSLYYSKSEKNIIAIGGERIGDYKSEYKSKNILTLNENEEIIENPTDEFLKNHKDDIVEILPIDSLGKRRVWRWSKRDEILKSCKNGDFNVVEKEGKYTVQLKDRIKEGRKPKTIWYDSKYDASSSGTMLLKSLFEGEKVFSYPKSLYTVRDTIQILTQPNENDIILDFFGGSATTAHAVIDLNLEDNGNRKFIICEQMDYIEKVSINRIQKVLNKLNCDYNFIYSELKKYNQEYLDQIIKCEKKDDLISIWNEMNDGAFLSYVFDKKTFNERMDSFKDSSLEDMKTYLMEVLDMNQLYVNYSEIEDSKFNIEGKEIELNNQFYSKGK